MILYLLGLFTGGFIVAVYFYVRFERRIRESERSKRP